MNIQAVKALAFTAIFHALFLGTFGV